MRKYYWLIAGLFLGTFSVFFAYWMLDFITIGGDLNVFSAIGVIVVYGIVLFLAGKIYDSLG